MIVAFAPGEYWEIEFLDDGAIDIERYRSNGRILDENALEELFKLCSDEETDSSPSQVMPAKKGVRVERLGSSRRSKTVKS
jgi:hypothetical protein